MTIKKYLSLQKYPFSYNFKISLLANIVQFILNKRLLQNDKLKVGDWVAYNWKAKFYINLIYKEKGNKPFKVLSIKHYESDYSFSIEYTDENGKIGSCDSFWLTKIKYKNETKPNA